MTNYYQFFLINSATSNGTNILLGLSGSPALANEGRVVLRFAPGINIPSTNNLPVAIVVDGTAYPVWDRYGNPLMGNELKPNSTGKFYCSRLNYLSYYGSTTPHFIVHNYPRVTCSFYGS